MKWTSDEESSPRTVDRKGLPITDVASSDRGGSQSSQGSGGLWDKLRQNPVIAKAVKIIDWILAGLKLVWAIPKAIVQGDSRALIEAIGDLLARATPTASSEPAIEDVPAASFGDAPPARSDGSGESIAPSGLDGSGTGGGARDARGVTPGQGGGTGTPPAADPPEMHGTPEPPVNPH